MERQTYPSDVSDDEWNFVAPYLTLMTEEAPQREHDVREVFNGLRWIIRTGAQWRMMPHDLPPWAAVYQPTRCATRLTGERNDLICLWRRIVIWSELLWEKRTHVDRNEQSTPASLC